MTLNNKPSGARHNAIVELEGAWDSSDPIAYWVIEGFVINGKVGGTNTYGGLEGRWLDHCTYRNCTVTGTSGPGGLYVSHGNNNTVQNCTAYSCGSGSGTHTSYQANSCTYNTYLSNTVYSSLYCGFHNNGDISGGGSGLVQYTVYDKNTAYGNGAKAFNCDGVCDSTFKNNLVYNNSASAFGLYATDCFRGLQPQ